MRIWSGDALNFELIQVCVIFVDNLNWHYTLQQYFVLDSGIPLCIIVALFMQPKFQTCWHEL